MLVLLVFGVCAAALAGEPERLRAGAEDFGALALPAPAHVRGRAPQGAFAERDLSVGAPGLLPLAAKLSVPAGAGPRTPAVIVLGGSGPSDMDGDGPAAFSADGRPTHDYKDISDAFARAGYITLRFNKRGVLGWDAKNGKPLTSEPVEDFTIEQSAEDALSALRQLRQGAPARRVLIVAHSEGTRLAPMLAEREHVDGMILLGPIAQPLEAVDRFQNVDRRIVRYRDVLDVDHDGFISEEESMREGPLTLAFALTPGSENGPVPLDAIARTVEALYPKGFALRMGMPWFKSLVELEPNEDALPRFRGPILLLQGENDEAMPPGEAQRLADALKRSGHPDFTLRVYPGLGHNFSPANRTELGAKNLETGGPFDPQVLREAVAWAQRRFSPSAR